MRNIDKIQIATLLLLLTGCYEEEKKLKNWAINDSQNYFEEIVRADAKARSEKLAQKMLSDLPPLDPLVKNFRTLVSLPDSLKESTNDPERDVIKNFRIYRDLFIDRSERIGVLSSKMDSLIEGGQRILNFCRDYFEDKTLPPVDAGAIAAALGQKSFSAYLSVSASVGSGPSGGGVSIDPYMDNNFIEYLVRNIIENPVKDIFSSEEERNALKDAQRIINENLPDSKKRSKLGQQECNESFTGLVETVRTRNEILSVLKKSLSRFHNRLTKNMQAYHGKILSLQAQSESDAAAERVRKEVATELFFKRGDVYYKYFGLLTHNLVEIIMKYGHGEIGEAREVYQASLKAVQELKNFMLPNDLEPYKERVAYYEKQLEAYSIKYPKLIEEIEATSNP